MGVISGAANLFFIYRFLRILTTAWEDSDAFKLGIIDENGKILKKKNKLKGKEEKEAYTMMHRFVWKMKRLMEKIPFGKSRLASYAAALWLIKEEKDFHGTDNELQESFLSFLETDWKNEALILKENYEGDMDKKTYSSLKLDEIAPWKKGKYKVTDGKTGKVLSTFNSGEKAQKYVDKIWDKGDYDSLTVELGEKVVYTRANMEEAVLVNRDYKYDGKIIKISKKNFKKVSKDYKNSTKGKETMITYDSKWGTVSVPVEFTEELEPLLKNYDPNSPEGTVCPKCDGEGCDHCDGNGYHTEAKISTFGKFLIEGRPAGKIRDDENTTTNKERQRLVASQEKNYTLKDIESIARKHKVRLNPVEPPMKFGQEWTIITDRGIKLIYDKKGNDTYVTGWRIDKKKLRQYKDKYENEETRIQDIQQDSRGRLSLRGFESAFEVIGEQLTEEGEGGIPANATGTAVVGTGDDPTVWKKKKRKNAKVETEEFGGKKVFVVSPERYWDSRMGKSRYNRYEKYVGNDKLGEAIRQYGITNPNSPIILKNSDTGGMLYLKYGK